VAELKARNQDIVASKAASVVVVGGCLSLSLSNDLCGFTFCIDKHNKIQQPIFFSS
jgi:hypothetical protein